MVAIVASDANQRPAHPDGRDWLVIWLSSEGGIIFADTISDVVGELVPGYNDFVDDDVDEDPYLHARIDVIAPLAAQAQALVLADLAERGLRLSEAELNAALANKELPYPLDKWTQDEPLVLLTTAYAPFSDVLRPAGNVLWLDPSNETAFLAALRVLGQGSLWVSGI